MKNTAINKGEIIMTKEEFIREAKREGRSNEYISAIIENHEKAIQAGIKPPPFEMYLLGEILSD